MNTYHAGTLERWWAVEYARLKAQIFVLFHWRCRIVEEYRWVSMPPHRAVELPQYLFEAEDDYAVYAKETTFIGVSTGRMRDRTLRIVRSYYGTPRVHDALTGAGG